MKIIELSMFKNCCWILVINKSYKQLYFWEVIRFVGNPPHLLTMRIRPWRDPIPRIWLTGGQLFNLIINAKFNITRLNDFILIELTADYYRQDY